MTDKSYSYTVLRYVHDIATGEFANIGVLLYAPGAGFVDAKLRRTYSRLSKFFPGMNGRYFRSTINRIQSGINKLPKADLDLFPASGISAIDIAKLVLPLDDSSLQWSDPGAGISSKPSEVLDQLYDRLVARYDKKSESESRADADVWKSFSRELKNRNLLSDFHEKEIRSDIDSVKFKHARKNGIWHCLEPVSFDLLEGEAIRNKAHRMLGEMTALQSARDLFKVYLLIGEPSRKGVQRHYDNALKILNAIPVESEIYTEDKAKEFSSVIAKEFANIN